MDVFATCLSGPKKNIAIRCDQAGRTLSRSTKRGHGGRAPASACLRADEEAEKCIAGPIERDELIDRWTASGDFNFAAKCSAAAERKHCHTNLTTRKGSRTVSFLGSFHEAVGIPQRN